MNLQQVIKTFSILSLNASQSRKILKWRRPLRLILLLFYEYLPVCLRLPINFHQPIKLSLIQTSFQWRNAEQPWAGVSIASKLPPRAADFSLFANVGLACSATLNCNRKLLNRCAMLANSRRPMMSRLPSPHRAPLTSCINKSCTLKNSFQSPRRSLKLDSTL